MKGPNGPNAVLQKMYRERNAIEIDDMPQYFKNFMVNMDRNAYNRNVTERVNQHPTDSNVQSPTQAYSWL